MIFSDVFYITNLLIESNTIYSMHEIKFRIVNNINKKVIYIIDNINKMTDSNIISEENILLHNNDNNNNKKYSIEDIIIKIIYNIDICKLLKYIYINSNQTFKKYRHLKYLTHLKDMFNNIDKYKYNISDTEWNIFIQDMNNNSDNITLLFKNLVSISYLYIIYKSDILKKEINKYININYNNFNNIKKLYFYNIYIYTHKIWIFDNIHLFLYNIINKNDNNNIIENYNKWKLYYINLLETKYYNLILEYNRIVQFHQTCSNKDFEDSDYEI